MDKINETHSKLIITALYVGNFFYSIYSLYTLAFQVTLATAEGLSGVPLVGNHSCRGH